MKKIASFFLSFKIVLAASCYSIITLTGPYTPVAPNNVIGEVPRYSKCKFFDESILFDSNWSYIGCDRNRSKIVNLYTRLKKIGFHFKDEKIVKHKMTNKDIYVIFPSFAYIKKYYNLGYLYKNFNFKKINRLFPKSKDVKYTFLDLKYAKFLPVSNVFRFYKYYKRHGFNTKILIIYNGTISLEDLYKKINNKNILQKRGEKTYILKFPLYVSPTASLVIKNKRLLLESYPKPIAIFYHGNLFIKNSSIYAWDLKHNRYHYRYKISPRKIVLMGIQRPRPYILGLSGSKTIFFNNILKGLGFYDIIGTYGVSLASFAKESKFYSSALNMFLASMPEATGVFIGNDFYDEMTGFYCEYCKKVTVLGNKFYNNLINNIDIHNYSSDVVIARNILYKSKNAQGIIFARGIKKSIIAENFLFKNHSNGIMIDKLSNYNLIYKNLSMENGFSGIAVQESDNIAVNRNYLLRNYINGASARNSLRVSFKNNYIFGNAKNGIQVYVKDLKSMIIRNFLRDPYHKAGSAVLYKNRIENNYNYNIIVKNSAAVKLIKNELQNKDINKNYGGDLNFFIDRIHKNRGVFTLYGRGQPFRAISSDLIKLNPYAFKKAIFIYKDISISPNDTAGVTLAKIYRIRKMYNFSDEEFKREASQIISDALYYLGFSLIIKEKQNSLKNKKNILDALSYIIEAVIMGNNDSAIDLTHMIYLADITPYEINKAFEIAVKRMKEGYLFDKNLFAKCVYCKLNNDYKLLTQSFVKIFMYNLKHNNFKNFYEYILFIRNKNPIFSREVIKSIYHTYYLSNKEKTKFYRVKEKIRSEANKYYSCKYFLNKNFYFNTQVLFIMNKNRLRDLKNFSKLIESYIKKVDTFRYRKIDKKEVYKILRENNEENISSVIPFVAE